MNSKVRRGEHRLAKAHLATRPRLGQGSRAARRGQQQTRGGQQEIGRCKYLLFLCVLC